jgi:hypothetical protein
VTVEDLKREVANLPRAEVTRLAAWLADYDAQLWDEQIEADLKAGRLDAIINQAERHIALRDSTPRPL